MLECISCRKTLDMHRIMCYTILGAVCTSLPRITRYNGRLYERRRSVWQSYYLSISKRLTEQQLPGWPGMTEQPLSIPPGQTGRSSASSSARTILTSRYCGYPPRNSRSDHSLRTGKPAAANRPVICALSAIPRCHDAPIRSAAGSEPIF